METLGNCRLREKFICEHIHRCGHVTHCWSKPALSVQRRGGVSVDRQASEERSTAE